MKTRWPFFVMGLAGASGSLMIGACAADEASARSDVDASAIVEAPNDGAPDGPLDGDGPPCSDCAYFPDACEADTFCLNGPFADGSAGTVDAGLDLRTQINVLRGRGVNDVWAAGALGALAHFDGQAWTVIDSGAYESLQAVWLRDSSEVTIGTLTKAYVRTGSVSDAGADGGKNGWSVAPIVSATPTFSASNLRFMAAFAAPSATHLWLATTSLRLGQSSGLWRLDEAEDGTYRLDVGIDSSVCSALPCSQIAGIHGTSADDLWAVGASGAAVHVTGADGDTPAIKAFNTHTWSALRGVWAASTNDVWAVGVNGTVRHYAGAERDWDVVADVPSTVNLNAVWGSSSNDVWAVGDGGTVLHYDGASWSRVKVAGLGTRRPDLTAVWMPEAGHVWIGGRGVVLSLGGKP